MGRVFDLLDDSKDRMTDVVYGIEETVIEITMIDVRRGGLAWRKKYRIYMDGSIEYSFEPGTIDIPEKTEEYKVRMEDFYKLVSDLIHCMKNASQNLNIIDDSGMEVELKYFSGGSIRLPRGLGNDNLYIGEVITRFFNEHGINIYK